MLRRARWLPVGAISNINLPTSVAGVNYTGMNYDFVDAPVISGSTSPVPSRPVIPIGVVPVTSSSASLSAALAVVGTNDRILAGSASSLGLTGVVMNSGSASSNWRITSLSGGLVVTPTSGRSLGGSKVNLMGTVNGAHLSAGTQLETLWLSPTNVFGQALGTSTSASVQIDPVLSRGSDPTSALSVTTVNLGRILQGATASTPLSVTSAGSYADYSNLTMNRGSFSMSDSNGSVFTVGNAASTTYNGTVTTNSASTSYFKAAFASAVSGPISGTAAIPANKGLFTGETLASGTPVLPTTLSVPYIATVLQPQQLQVVSGTSQTPINLPVPAGDGGLLCGAVVNTGFSVMATSDSNHATLVNVTGSANAVWTGDSGTPVGLVTATPTTISNSGTFTVPVSIAALSMGQYNGAANVGVVSAEAAAVHDNTNYAPLAVTYNAANVGYAATGGLNSSGGTQQFGAPLASGPIAQGTPIASFSAPSSYLSSVVQYSGTAGAASNYQNSSSNTNTIISSGTVTAANVAGTVGSQCDILDSTAVTSGSTTVSMAWRGRNSNENFTPSSTLPSVLPSGVQWLTSDVVDIAGVPSSTTIAMEMTFDDGINEMNDKGATANVAGSYIAEWTGSAWVNATKLSSHVSSEAVQGYNGTLAAFLQNEYSSPANAGLTHDQILADLAGSWGAALDPGGVGTSWAIVNNLQQTGSQFAVVPEPSTFALLGAGLASLLIYGVRRKTRGPSLAA